MGSGPADWPLSVCISVNPVPVWGLKLAIAAPPMMISFEQFVEMDADIVPVVEPATATGTAEFESKGDVRLTPATPKAMMENASVPYKRSTLMISFESGALAIAYHSSSEILTPSLLRMGVCSAILLWNVNVPVPSFNLTTDGGAEELLERLPSVVM